jgi:hypothetical protein
MFLNQSPNLGKFYRRAVAGQELSQKPETDLLQKIFRNDCKYSIFKNFLFVTLP